MPYTFTLADPCGNSYIGQLDDHDNKNLTVADLERTEEEKARWGWIKEIVTSSELGIRPVAMIFSGWVERGENVSIRPTLCSRGSLWPEKKTSCQKKGCFVRHTLFLLGLSEVFNLTGKRETTPIIDSWGSPFCLVYNICGRPILRWPFLTISRQNSINGWDASHQKKWELYRAIWTGNRPITYLPPKLSLACISFGLWPFVIWHAELFCHPFSAKLSHTLL